jgi:hypothetical protein
MLAYQIHVGVEVIVQWLDLIGNVIVHLVDREKTVERSARLLVYLIIHVEIMQYVELLIINIFVFVLETGLVNILIMILTAKIMCMFYLRRVL